MTDEKLNGIIKALKLCTGSETVCKDCPYRASVSPSFSVRCEDTLHEACLEAIEALQAKNAALHEKLEKAVELPCKIGDTVYKVYDKCDMRYCLYNGYSGQWRCHYEGERRCASFILTKEFCYSDIPFVNKTVFASRECAEARLKELQGEEE